jgi:hypothetical protein
MNVDNFVDYLDVATGAEGAGCGWLACVGITSSDGLPRLRALGPAKGPGRRRGSHCLI